MIPIQQTILGGPGETAETSGNCYAACVASILELPIKAVPNFPTAGDEWAACVQEFLAPFSLHMQWLNVEEDEQWRGVSPEHWWIASYKFLGRDWGHSVVMHGERMAHDPMPGAELRELDRTRLALIEWIGITDPAVAVRGSGATLVGGDAARLLP